MSDHHTSSPRQSLASYTHASSVSNSIPGFSHLQPSPHIVSQPRVPPALVPLPFPTPAPPPAPASPIAHFGVWHTPSRSDFIYDEVLAGSRSQLDRDGTSSVY